jgi:thiamine-phosphate pyrophosphorylase
MLGPGRIIGVSIDSSENLERANKLSIDYVGVGAIFPTKNKANVAMVWGLDGLRKISAISKHPVIAIGGIDEYNAGEVIKAGASGIAAIRVFHDAVSPQATCKNLIDIIS